ncbi:MAG TPA: TIM barrel protein [Vicinamibacterales bacterium]|nr:TIM barrel protein [Vicinamibacterales bacterium]
MAALTRREFVAGVMATALAARIEASPLGLPIGSQTYPHRQTIGAGDFAGLLETLKEIGVEAVELCSAIGYKEFAPLADARAVKRTLGEHGMKCESAHFSLRELRDNQQKSIDWAREIGMTQMVVATLGGGRTPAMDDVKRAADEYNAIAAVAAKAGMQQVLHNEGFEVSMVDGRRTYDILMDLLDPKLVKFQFQMSTINQGLVAEEYFTKYPGRFISMHVQDVDMNAPVPEGGRGRPQTAVGKGSIDWAKTFKAARTGGVKNYFVEQNMELTKASVAALKAMNV